MSEYTQEIRKTVVVSVEVNHSKKGDMFFPRACIPEGEDPEEIWWLWIVTRSGLLPEQRGIAVYMSEAEANEAAKKFTPGTEIGGPVDADGEAKRREFIQTFIDQNMAPSCAGHAGDEESGLAFDVLQKAGIDTGFHISEKVSDFLGKERVDFLKDKHGENWKSAANYEYCWMNLPHSSPAYVAATYQFHWYITGNDFAAGYYWRDLECLVYGVEQAAIQSSEMRQKAGAKGREKSSAARAERRLCLLAAMEDIAERNPDIAKLGQAALAALALQACIENAPTLWTQGRGQVDEYLGEIRRGDAGKEIRARYFALFPATVPVSKTA